MNPMFEVLKNIVKENRGLDKINYLFIGVFWLITKRLGISFDKCLWNGANLKVYPDSSYSAIFYFRMPDRECLEFIRKNNFLGDTFVDVGANVGIVSMIMLDKFKSIVMFEPTPATFKALTETMDLNRNKGVQLVAHNKAVSDTEGSLSFIAEGGMSQTNRVAKLNEKEATITVQTCKLDDILKDNNKPIILKVDVEGYEEQVFRGARNLFSNKAPKLVMFERLGRTNLDNILAFMNMYDYRVFRVLENGNISVDHADIAEPLINLFACPNEVFPLLSVA